jgi:hypothetical protein
MTGGKRRRHHHTAIGSTALSASRRIRATLFIVTVALLRFVPVTLTSLLLSVCRPTCTVIYWRSRSRQPAHAPMSPAPAAKVAAFGCGALLLLVSLAALVAILGGQHFMSTATETAALPPVASPAASYSRPTTSATLAPPTAAAPELKSSNANDDPHWPRLTAECTAPCIQDNCSTPAGVAACLRNINPFRPSKASIRRHLKRTALNETIAFWVSRGGLGRKALEMSAALGSVVLWVAPPHVEVLGTLVKHQDPRKTALFAADVARAVNNSEFVAVWSKHVGAALKTDARYSGTGAKGFLLALNFEDVASRDGLSSGLAIYSEGPVSPQFMVLDPYFGADDVPLASYRNTRYDVFVASLFNTSAADLQHALRHADGAPPPSPVHADFLPWSDRKAAAYFAGGPTHAIRRVLQRLTDDTYQPGRRVVLPMPTYPPRLKVLNNMTVLYSYGAKAKAAMQPLSIIGRFKAVWAIRGQSASLRDRQLLASGAAMFRIMNVATDDEPWQLYHRLLEPYVNYVAFYYRQSVFKISKFCLKDYSCVPHLRGGRLMEIQEALFNDRDRELQVMADNNFHLALQLADRAFRDELLRDVLLGYVSVLRADAVLLNRRDAAAFVDRAKRLYG